MTTATRDVRRRRGWRWSLTTKRGASLWPTYREVSCHRAETVATAPPVDGGPRVPFTEANLSPCRNPSDLGWRHASVRHSGLPVAWSGGAHGGGWACSAGASSELWTSGGWHVRIGRKSLQLWVWGPCGGQRLATPVVVGLRASEGWGRGKKEDGRALAGCRRTRRPGPATHVVHGPLPSEAGQDRRDRAEPETRLNFLRSRTQITNADAALLILKKKNAAFLLLSWLFPN